MDWSAITANVPPSLELRVAVLAVLVGGLIEGVKGVLPPPVDATQQYRARYRALLRLTAIGAGFGLGAILATHGYWLDAPRPLQMVLSGVAGTVALGAYDTAKSGIRGRLRRWLGGGSPDDTDAP